MRETVPSVDYSLSYMNPFLYNVTHPKYPDSFGNSICYTGLGRMSFDIPASTRVILYVNPSSTNTVQTLMWLGNGALYEYTTSAQPLTKMTTSGNVIDRIRPHRSAINIFNTTSGNDIGGIVKFLQTPAVWAPDFTSINNGDVNQGCIDLVMNEVNSDYSTRMVGGRAMGNEQHTVIISPNKWADYTDFHDFSGDVSTWAAVQPGLSTTSQPMMAQFIVFEPCSHVQSYDISFSTQYSLQVANNYILSQVKQATAGVMAVKDDKFIKDVIKQLQDARDKGKLVNVSEEAKTEDTTRGRGRPRSEGSKKK